MDDKILLHNQTFFFKNGVTKKTVDKATITAILHDLLHTSFSMQQTSSCQMCTKLFPVTNMFWLQYMWTELVPGTKLVL